MRVTVIDYKAGNLTSVLKALGHLGVDITVTDGAAAPIEGAERIVMPGVGHFAATERLDATGMTPAIRMAIEPRDGSRLLAGITPGEFVYFTHAYRAPLTADTAATTEYMGPFSAAVER